MKTFLTLIIAAMLGLGASAATTVITVKAPKGDATAMFNKAFARAAKAGGDVEISLEPGVYNFYADKANARHYRVSNTTGATEHPNAIKHIGLLMRDLHNVTVNGHGHATLLIHGEMTTWAMDSCSNMTLTGLTLDSADPTVTEMTVTERTDNTITARVNRDCNYAIRDGKLFWTGYKWEFTDGIAQLFSPRHDSNLRTDSPVKRAERVEEVEPGLLRFHFKDKALPCEPGQTFQMRHSFRREVAGLINGCSDVTLSHLKYAFMGNFGIVAQMSTNVTYSYLDCSPLEGSGRTNVGFADFCQFSSCRGLVKVTDCNFAGSHDDPINVHGTHQKITYAQENVIHVRYMHHQTFGFVGFVAGDTIQAVNQRTLLPAGDPVTVREVKMLDEYTTELLLSAPARSMVADAKADMENGYVVENLTWTPAVDVERCRFIYTPVRGILVTTLRPVLIKDNVFIRCPMSAILIADDARSWYESGAVRDVTITDNEFVDCSNPVIMISPEANPIEAPVHSGITISHNTFRSDSPVSVSATAVEGLKIIDNRVVTHDGRPQKFLMQ